MGENTSEQLHSTYDLCFSDPWLMVEAIVLMILLIMSICLECKEQNLADNEVVDGVRHIITTLSGDEDLTNLMV